MSAKDNKFKDNTKSGLVYSSRVSKELFKANLKIILLYSIIFIFWIVVVKMYANFGVKWVVPAVSAMWIMGAVTTHFVPDDRENTVKSTRNAIAGFLLFLFMYRFVIRYIGNISAAELAISLGINITATAGMAISAWLQNILLITSVMTPVGFLVWCAQKFKTFNGRETKSGAFNRIKDIRKDTGRRF